MNRPRLADALNGFGILPEYGQEPHPVLYDWTYKNIKQCSTLDKPTTASIIASLTGSISCGTPVWLYKHRHTVRANRDIPITEQHLPARSN